MRSKGAPMTPSEVYAAISGASLYEFKAQNLAAIVAGQIRRHCEGFQSGSPAKIATSRAQAVAGTFLSTVARFSSCLALMEAVARGWQGRRRSGPRRLTFRLSSFTAFF